MERPHQHSRAYGQRAYGPHPNNGRLPGRPHGGRGVERHHLGDMDDFDEGHIDPYGHSSRSGPQGRRGAGFGSINEYGAMTPYVLGGPTDLDVHPSSHRPGPRTRVPERQYTPEPFDFGPGRSLRELEESLDKEEQELELYKGYAKQHVNPDGSKDGSYIHERIGHMKANINTTKMAIQRIDPGSEKLRNSDISNPYLPPQAGHGHQESGSRHGRRGPAPLRAHGYHGDHGHHGDHGYHGDHGHHGARRSNAPSERY